jgi:hypothetical protein
VGSTGINVIHLTRNKPAATIWSGVLSNNASANPTPPQPCPTTYILTLKEKNLTTQQLTNQNFVDMQLPNGQIVNLTGTPLFFNATGVVHGGRIQHLDLTNLGTASGLFIWVIVATGSNNELRIGVPTIRLGHAELPMDGRCTQPVS